MSELSDLVYCPLKEDDGQLTGWSKSTIEYCTHHKSRVYASIRGIAKSHGKMLSMTDTDDVYEELLQYLYQCDDYNISKACSTNSKSVVSLEGYVHSCLKFVTIRFVTKMYVHESNTVVDTVHESDGKEMSLFDTIPDEDSEQFVNNVAYDLRTVCESYEYTRYLLGPDIFQIWYIMLKTIQCGKREKYKDILTILGISKKDMSKIEENAMRDSVMLNIAKAVTVKGVDESLEILMDFTYCYDKLASVIEMI